MSQCLHCKKELKEITKWVVEEIGKKLQEMQTQNTIEICVNPKCWSFIDLEKVRYWK